MVAEAPEDWRVLSTMRAGSELVAHANIWSRSRKWYEDMYSNLASAISGIARSARSFLGGIRGGLGAQVTVGVASF